MTFVQNESKVKCEAIQYETKHWQSDIERWEAHNLVRIPKAPGCFKTSQTESKPFHMRLFLDDFREPWHCLSYMGSRIGLKQSVFAEDWTVVRDFHQFTEAVMRHHGKITLVSFDHDLCDAHYDHALMTDPAAMQAFYERKDREMTGFDCAVWMRDFFRSKGLALPEIIVHSMNPVGTVNIEEVFSNPTGRIQTPLIRTGESDRGQESPSVSDLTRARHRYIGAADGFCGISEQMHHPFASPSLRSPITGMKTNTSTAPQGASAPMGGGSGTRHPEDRRHSGETAQ
jgi:hypothetical protein